MSWSSNFGENYYSLSMRRSLKSREIK